MDASTANGERKLSSESTPSTWKWLRASISHRSMMTGVVIGTVLVLVAIVGPVVTPHSPSSLDTSRILFAPSSENLFGTDRYGRDLLSRVVYGSRISLTVGLSVALLAGIAGTLAGLASGYFPRVDNVLMRFMDILMAFPGFLLAICIMAILGPHLGNVIAAMSIVATPGVARIIRGAVLQLKRVQFVEAALANGSSNSRIVFRHILPNCIAPLTVQLTVIFATAVLGEASLSFIGAGVPPEVPSWGIILADGRNYLQSAPWVALFPGIGITITVLAVNLLGDGLRDIADPHLRHR